MPDLGIVVPFYNEERTAAPVVRDLVSVLDAAGLDFEVALVGDGSTDGTADVLEGLARADARIRAVSEPDAQGYGAAILHGFSLLRSDVVGWMDGDGQVPPATVVDIYRAMQRERAALGMGQRHRREDGIVRAVASRGYNLLMRRMLGVHFPDVNAKPKLLRRDALHAVAPVSRDWFIDTEIVAGIVARQLPVVRVPVPFLARRHGSSKVRASILVQYTRNLRAHRRRLREPAMGVADPQPQDAD